MLDQRSQRHVGRTLGGGQRPHPEVHLTVAQREDPAVPGQHLSGSGSIAGTAGGRPQFQVRGDPRLIGARGVQVGPRCHPVDGLLMPLPTQRPAQGRSGAIGHDQPTTGHPPAVGEYHRGHPPGGIEVDVDGLGPQQHPRPGVLGGFAHPIVEFGAGHRRTGLRERRPRPAHFEVAAETGQPQPVVADPAVEPVAEAELA